MSAATRRQFLTRAGSTAAAATVGGQLGWLTGRAHGRGVSAADWRRLSSQLGSKVVRPGDSRYTQITRPLNRRYADIHPRGVVLCGDASDVGTAVIWARENGVPVVVRSGGHNYAGYSTGPGLVVNVGGMRGVAVDDSHATVTVGPGVPNTKIYAALQPHGVAISAGRCPTVAVGGLVLGGGIGFSSRKLGLTCDHLIEAELVTANGLLRRCNEREHADLFWALRGAGSGNFGVCTSFTFATKPVDDVTLYDIEWDWADAAAVFKAFQEVIGRAPDEFSARLGVGRAGNPQTGARGTSVISALGQFFGAEKDLAELLAPALRAGRVKKKLIARRTFWQAKQYLFHSTPHTAYAVKSAYLDGPLSDQGIEVLLDAFTRWPGSHNTEGASAALFASGGAINRVAPDATAFVHRDKYALLATEATWTPKDSPRTVARNLAWIEGLTNGLRPHVSSSAYQNFIDRSQPDWQHAYYGQNFRRLTKIKRRVDPGNLFTFQQSIPRAA